MDKLQSELIKSNKETKAIEAEKQSCSEEVAVQKQKVKYLHYQLQQISNLTKVRSRSGIQSLFNELFCNY